VKALLLLLVPSLAAAEVNLDDAGKAISDAIAKVDLKHAKFGETLTIDSIAPLPSSMIDTTKLRTSFAGLRLKVIDDRTHGNKIIITVQAQNNARARIEVEQGGGTILLTARPASPTLPGKCVAIPDVDYRVNVESRGIDQSGKRGLNTTTFELATTRIFDVDGDGLIDAFVPVAKKHTCPEDVKYRVFVVRGACGHDLGVIGPGEFAFDAGTTAIDASGFRPFVLTAEKTQSGSGVTPEMKTTVRTFAAKRGKYAQTEIKTKTGKCHHCSTWSCVSP